MNRCGGRWRCWLARTIAGLLLISSVESTAGLPDEFVAAEPRVQLYMAYAQFKMANHEQARLMWEQIEGAGRGEAAFNLGILYEQGLGVTPDLQRALDYYREAAQLGSRSAAYQLGLMHQAAPQLIDRQEARHWLSLAALDGDPDAAALLETLSAGDGHADPLVRVRTRLISGDQQRAVDELQQLVSLPSPSPRAITLLAWLYERGTGVEQNLATAAALFQQAATAGDAEAQYALAVMYTTGRGQQQDADQARYWFEQSAAQGYSPAQQALEPGAAEQGN